VLLARFGFPLSLFLPSGEAGFVPFCQFILRSSLYRCLHLLVTSASGYHGNLTGGLPKKLWRH